MPDTTAGTLIPDARAAAEAPARAQGAREPRERVGVSTFLLAGLVVGVLGVVLAAVLTGTTLVRLATGSMAPTYPADSVLVVRSVPAGEVRVGDIVTVTRDGAVPITHRVVAVSPRVGGAELVLRGDANPADDPEPYQVSRVGLVLGGIPFGGSALAAIQSPLGLGLATMLVASLALWAWWPRREPGAHVMGRD